MGLGTRALRLGRGPGKAKGLEDRTPRPQGPQALLLRRLRFGRYAVERGLVALVELDVGARNIGRQFVPTLLLDDERRHAGLEKSVGENHVFPGGKTSRSNRAPRFGDRVVLRRQLRNRHTAGSSLVLLIPLVI